ncbi:hypothetical protein [Sporosarcina beigongshangi]|uniref:hypothetical protein n=1 Tax=Sporosarcina beigongshangi TaxID=2782538 RepID=UPI0019399D58|nr:hypothetical protein [Sporosarcina beigongshangi]
MQTISNGELKNKIISIYESTLKSKLDNVAIEITELIEKLIDIKVSNPDEYNLTHNNSGYLGRYYKVVSRVKSGESLGEKLVKKDALLEIKKEIEFTNIDAIVDDLKNRYSDLIGIKVLGDLKIDVNNILKLIQDNKNKFINNDSSKYITFENIEKQPDTMTNGSEIIKIDCTYHNDSEKHKFELQIKSQLTSAWGDMEHQQFYKNNKFSPVRKAHEPIMQDVGKLIEQLDTLLLSIRISENTYQINEEYWGFTSDIQNEFSKMLIDLFEVSVDAIIPQVSKLLFILFGIVDPNKDNYNLELDILGDIESGRFNNIDYGNDNFIYNFVNFRQVRFKLKIIESIMLVWYSSKTQVNTSEENYIEFIKWYFQMYLKMIEGMYEIDTEDEEVPFSPIFYNAINKAKSESCYIEPDNFNEVVEYYKFTKDAYIEWIQEEESVFPLEVLYAINYLFTQHHINETPLKDIEISLEKKIVIPKLDEYVSNLIKDEEHTLNEKFIQISKDIQMILRRGEY